MHETPLPPPQDAKLSPLTSPVVKERLFLFEDCIFMLPVLLRCKKKVTLKIFEFKYLDCLQQK